MLYKGKIENLERMVVSDPSYGEDVWCRYERNEFPARKDWAVHLRVNHSVENVEGFDLSGVSFALMICLPEFQKVCRLGDEEGTFFHPMSMEVGSPFEIGMDTACVALGINGRADMIKDSKDEWKPPFALNTMTDGFFGNVFEGKRDGKVEMVVVTGYLDDDAGYDINDVVDYLVDSFQIQELEMVADKKIGLNRQIVDAERARKDADKLNDNKERDDCSR